MHLSEELIDEYVLQRLSAEQLDFVEEHLLICDECRQKVDIADQLIAALRNIEQKPPSES